jgi:hypothetical protein
MIIVTNKINTICKNDIVLNLSDAHLNISSYDISLKIIDYKEKLKSQYLKSFDKITPDSFEELTYTFSYLSWKSYFVKNSFIEIIYYFVFLEFKAKNDLVVYIESRELAHFIKHKHKDEVNIILNSNFTNILQSTVRPYFYLFKMIKSKIKYGFKKSSTRKIDVLLYSYPQDRTFQKDTDWTDSFLGDLYQEIKNLGFSINRFVPLEPLQYEKQLKDRKEYVISLIEYFRLKDIFSLLFQKSSLKNTINNLKNIIIDQKDFSLLYKKHLESFEASNIAFVRYSFYFLFKRMIKRVKPKVIIYLYENQPWEKSINKVCNDNGIITIAINHSMISSDMLSLYNDTNISKDFYPLQLIANGKVEYDLLKYMNRNDYVSLSLIGSKRHIYPQMKFRKRNQDNLQNIAIILSGTKNEFLDMVDILNKYSDDLKEYIFYFKPPPGSYYTVLKNVFQKNYKSIKFNCVFFEGDLDEVFSCCETVIFSSTTVGLEAYISNKLCLRYLPRSNYDLDFTETLNSKIYTISHSDFIRKIKQIDYNQDNSIINTSDYFQLWDRVKFQELLSGILK